MKTSTFIILSVAVCLAMTTDHSVAQSTPGSMLTVMTFNLRYGTAKDEGHLWPDRKTSALTAITETHPDVLGLQEAEDFQNEYFIENLGAEYEFVGEGRGGGTDDEYSSIFFRKSRFFLARAGRFWLSDTPEVVGSKSWANLPRIVTWIDLVERGSGVRIFALNTHFAHDSDVARKKSAVLIRQRLAELVPAGARVIMMGDFNCIPGSEPYLILLGEGGGALQDSRVATGVSPTGTFHDFKGPSEGGQPIDWILFGKGLKANEYKVLDGKYAGVFPSDHFPVMATFQIE